VLSCAAEKAGVYLLQKKTLSEGEEGGRRMLRKEAVSERDMG